MHEALVIASHTPDGGLSVTVTIDCIVVRYVLLVSDYAAQDRLALMLGHDVVTFLYTTARRTGTAQAQVHLGTGQLRSLKDLEKWPGVAVIDEANSLAAA